MTQLRVRPVTPRDWPVALAATIALTGCGSGEIGDGGGPDAAEVDGPTVAGSSRSSPQPDGTAGVEVSDEPATEKPAAGGTLTDDGQPIHVVLPGGDDSAPPVEASIVLRHLHQSGDEQPQYVVLSVASDGAVTEHWRFDSQPPASGDPSAYSVAITEPNIINPDFTRLAARSGSANTGGVGYLTAQEEYVELIGPGHRSAVRYGPDGRLYYWDFESNVRGEFTALSEDGRTEVLSVEESLLPPGQHFRFTSGGMGVPIYTVDGAAIVSDDGSMAAKKELNGLQVGPVEGLGDVEVVVPTSNGALEPLTFLPGSNSEFLATNRLWLYLCTIDRGQVTAVEWTVPAQVSNPVPTGGEVTPSVTGASVLPDGTIVVTSAESVYIDNKETFATRVVQLEGDGSFITSTLIAEQESRFRTSLLRYQMED